MDLGSRTGWLGAKVVWLAEQPADHAHPPRLLQRRYHRRCRNLPRRVRRLRRLRPSNDVRSVRPHSGYWSIRWVRSALALVPGKDLARHVAADQAHRNTFGLDIVRLATHGAPC